MIFQGAYRGLLEWALVLQVQQRVRLATVLMLKSGQRADLPSAQLSSWRLLPTPAGRWVELRKQDTHYREWAGYLPDFESSISVWEHFRGKRGYEVKLFPGQIDEMMLLDGIGYYGD